MKILPLNIRHKVAIVVTSGAMLIGVPKVMAQNVLKRDAIYDEFVKRPTTPELQDTALNKKTLSFEQAKKELPSKKQIVQPKDNVKTNNVTSQSKKITPKGTSHPDVLAKAPSPNITIKGKQKTAIIVVNLSKNVLYTYDKSGEPTAAYLIASGKRSTPTHTGVRIVSHIETYPYKTAPASTKRHQNPGDYGPKAIILKKIHPLTGQTSSTGEFLHGNANSKTLGMYVSKGCMRMDNEVIKKIASETKPGDLIIIKRD